VNTGLEEALENVLVRYGVPAYGLRKGEADRGDLSSDLAEAARMVPSRPDPDGYELVLGELYVRMRTAYEAHPEHVIGPARDSGMRACPSCGEPVRVDAEPEQRCGGSAPTEQCNELGGILWGLVEAAVPSTPAARWLARPPASDFLDWDSDVASSSLREHVADVLQHDAVRRIQPDYALIPVNPARTVREASDG
jgi:hypothetical protein